MRVAYAGTPDFAVPALDALIAGGHEVAVVYTQPDRSAGRGRELRASPVKVRAQERGLPIEQPLTLKDPAAASRLAAYNVDVMVVAAYGLLLPPDVLGTPRWGCLNIHASLLPRWRGAAPVQRAIEAGDLSTGISIMRMEAGLDTGPVYEVCEMPIAADETAGMLTARLADRGAQCLLHVLAQLQRGEAIAVPQESQGVVYAHKLEKRESVLDWADSAAVLAAKIRAFDPWPVAQTLCAGEVLRIWAAQVCAGSVAPPGTVVAITPAGIDVATGAGCLRLTRVQAAGRKPVTAREFMNAAGGSLAVGTALGL